MTTGSRTIVYVLGAGFSYGSNHEAPVGRHIVHMPLQYSLFEELCRFHHRKIKRLDQIAKVIRRFFNPLTYRATREGGSRRHSDLFGLSVEEIVTFFDEILSNGLEGIDDIRAVANDLQVLTVELISYLSINGNPGQNALLKSFAKRLAQTDVIITFNWDTILDRVLANQTKYQWHPSWGYGKTVRKEFRYGAQNPPPVPRKYPRLLKLHGSINWTASANERCAKRVIQREWHPGERFREVVMMPPKMIKPEVHGHGKTVPLTDGPWFSEGNNATSDEFYPHLWMEAEKQLARCRRLVFIGYSFPAADFAVGNLLRRAISTMKNVDGRFPEVDIVDPNAAQLALRFKQSFKIDVPINNQYLSLGSYLSGKRAT